jgi:hypothetical protein
MMPVEVCAKAAGEKATTRLKTSIAILIDVLPPAAVNPSREKYTWESQGQRKRLERVSS